MHTAKKSAKQKNNEKRRLNKLWACSEMEVSLTSDSEQYYI